MVEAAARGDLSQLELSPADRVWLEFAHLLTVHPHRNSPDEIQKLRDAGWSDPQIRETVLVVGMFSMFNRVADAFGLQDPDYFNRAQAGEGIRPATRPS